MDQDFLRKEEELRNENKQLEQRTKELFQKVDDIKKLQDFELQNFKLKKTEVHKPIDPKDLNLPKCVDEMGTKGMIHFYKSKIRTLQEDLNKAQTEIKNKNEELKKIRKEYQVASEEKEKWFLHYNGEKNSSTKLEKHVAACNSKLQVKDAENIALKKEIEQLKTDLKNSCNELCASESRLKKALHDIETHKISIKTLRDQEKEAKERYRDNLKELTATVKKVQKHKNELLHGYKKQIQLIDNLKKQKAHIESYKVLELAESEFFKLLDWKIED